MSIYRREFLKGTVAGIALFFAPPLPKIIRDEDVYDITIEANGATISETYEALRYGHIHIEDDTWYVIRSCSPEYSNARAKDIKVEGNTITMEFT